MPAERVPMRSVREILRLRAEGLSRPRNSERPMQGADPTPTFLLEEPAENVVVIWRETPKNVPQGFRIDYVQHTRGGLNLLEKNMDGKGKCCCQVLHLQRCS